MRCGRIRIYFVLFILLIRVAVYIEMIIVKTTRLVVTVKEDYIRVRKRIKPVYS